MKRVLTVQDISCVGKCSLTVALPIISALGVEAAVLPTAVLSNHTAFKSFTFRDLTDDLDGIFDCWERERIDFDGIYTGYLGSIRQIDIVLELFSRFGGEGVKLIVDPAMADNGKLYHGFDISFAAKMAELCARADIIVPNLTETALILNEPYIASGYDEDYIKDKLERLTSLGARVAVITGVSLGDNQLGAYGYDSERGEFFSCFKEMLPVTFHGTGDIFASALCGAVTRGKSLEDSVKIAVDYTVECIRLTMENEHHNWYGVDFESAIPYLIELIK